MTATIDDVAKKKPTEVTAEQQAAIELVRLAKEQGLSLTGPDGLLKQLTKSVIETALSEEMTEHPSRYPRHESAKVDLRSIARRAMLERSLAPDFSAAALAEPQ